MLREPPRRRLLQTCSIGTWVRPATISRWWPTTTAHVTRIEPACPTRLILGHPSPRQRRSLPLASLRDSPRLPLTPAWGPGLERCHQPGRQDQQTTTWDGDEVHPASRDHPDGASSKPPHPEQIVPKLREADRLLAEGREVPEVAKHLEVSEATYHRWRAPARRAEGRRCQAPEGAGGRERPVEADRGRQGAPDPGAHGAGAGETGEPGPPAPRRRAPPTGVRRLLAVGVPAGRAAPQHPTPPAGHRPKMNRAANSTGFRARGSTQDLIPRLRLLGSFHVLVTGLSSGIEAGSAARQRHDGHRAPASPSHRGRGARGVTPPLPRPSRRSTIKYSPPP